MNSGRVMSEPEFYFALPRLMAKLRGKSAGRGERNAFEAHVVGAVIFLISYLSSAQFINPRAPAWHIGVLLIILLFVTWVFWLLVLYIDALVLKFLRAIGFFRSTPDAHVQSVLIGILTTTFACELSRRGSWSSIVGIIWLFAVVVNLTAALILALTNGESRARH